MTDFMARHCPRTNSVRASLRGFVRKQVSKYLEEVEGQLCRQFELLRHEEPSSTGQTEHPKLFESQVVTAPCLRVWTPPNSGHQILSSASGRCKRACHKLPFSSLWRGHAFQIFGDRRHPWLAALIGHHWALKVMERKSIEKLLVGMFMSLKLWNYAHLFLSPKNNWLLANLLGGKSNEKIESEIFLGSRGSPANATRHFKRRSRTGDKNAALLMSGEYAAKSSTSDEPKGDASAISSMQVALVNSILTCCRYKPFPLARFWLVSILFVLHFLPSSPCCCSSSASLGRFNSLHLRWIVPGHILTRFLATCCLDTITWARKGLIGASFFLGGSKCNKGTFTIYIYKMGGHQCTPWIRRCI